MFGMIPFDHRDNNVFDTFDSFARDFFRNSNTTLPAFRTDIRDTGDSYLLEADLPGFNKEDITLVGMARSPAASTSPALTKAASVPHMKTAS